MCLLICTTQNHAWKGLFYKTSFNSYSFFQFSVWWTQDSIRFEASQFIIKSIWCTRILKDSACIICYAFPQRYHVKLQASDNGTYSITEMKSLKNTCFAFNACWECQQWVAFNSIHVSSYFIRYIVNWYFWANKFRILYCCCCSAFNNFTIILKLISL